MKLILLVIMRTMIFACGYEKLVMKSLYAKIRLSIILVAEHLRFWKKSG